MSKTTNVALGKGVPGTGGGTLEPLLDAAEARVQDDSVSAQKLGLRRQLWEPGRDVVEVAGLEADGAVLDEGQGADTVPLGLEDVIAGVEGPALAPGLHRLDGPGEALLKHCSGNCPRRAPMASFQGLDHLCAESS